MIRIGWCRTEINKKVGRVNRAFRWAVENELVSPTIRHGLQAVIGLRKGRSDALLTAEVYAERDFAEARRVMAEIG
ncbi:hypothetical protein [Thalassoroseus pseudoceratinae]|uniref:hypothetical protein n=1 Tax=Thalassoroseus pseudoceratinae TaxID=2713176 RepID=UPI0014246F79|nr:hypothetical protein [Thalassoroseus pseudoceratinae]